MISTLILTKNEQVDLPGCLASLAWCDDIHVLDSFSVDRTVAIAEAAGVRVAQRKFDDFATQRNYALAELPFKYKWVLIVDADERPAESLATELALAIAGAESDVGGFRLRRRDYFRDTWLKHAQLSPFFTRVVRPHAARYTRTVNELLEVDGRLLNLKSPLFHYPFSKGLSHWLTKHDLYSAMEAELIVNGRSLQSPSLEIAFLSSDFHQRRLHQKAIFYKLPARPLIKLCYMLFIRGALLDGSAGVTYSILQSFYEYMIVLKTRELRTAASHRSETHLRDAMEAR
jgi:glycosyltransferase involved in cell wall biosynthesis